MKRTLAWLIAAALSVCVVASASADPAGAARLKVKTLRWVNWGANGSAGPVSGTAKDTTVALATTATNDTTEAISLYDDLAAGAYNSFATAHAGMKVWVSTDVQGATAFDSLYVIPEFSPDGVHWMAGTRIGAAPAAVTDKLIAVTVSETMTAQGGREQTSSFCPYIRFLIQTKGTITAFYSGRAFVSYYGVQ